MRPFLIAPLALALGTATPAAPLRFEPYAYETADGRRVEGERATLVVPERRAAPGRTIELSIVRLRATGPARPEPILYLDGSPSGGAASDALRAPRAARFIDRLREAGDVIVLDYRGTGLSRPRLSCAPTPPRGDTFASRERAI